LALAAAAGGFANMTKDEFLYFADHDWDREERIRREIAREVYIANHGHPAQNTVAGLLGVVGLLALAIGAVFWATADDDPYRRYRYDR
jgi:hypothetical protein